MPLFVKARSFLRNVLLSRSVEMDLDLEVHSHFEMLTGENIRAGMSPQERLASKLAKLVSEWLSVPSPPTFFGWFSRAAVDSLSPVLPSGFSQPSL
jgi:hypothetical protein